MNKLLMIQDILIIQWQIIHYQPNVMYHPHIAFN
jgi:hypothetical protein